MRHRNSGRKLGRTSAHRKAMFKNMATALLTYGRITTTEAKAKEIRSVVEPLITLAQKDDLHSRRQAYRVLGNHKLVKRLFDEIGPLFKGMEKGGYTRVVKLANPRKGDAAPMAIIELLNGPHYQTAEKAAEKPAPAKKAAAPKAKKAEAAAEAPAEESKEVKKAPAKKAPAKKAEGKEEKAAKPKAASKPKAAAPKPKSETKSSKVAGSKPKSTPRKIGS